jgi:hypothetical protein
MNEWEAFYAQYRDEEEKLTDEEYEKLSSITSKDTEIDLSRNVCILISRHMWEDIYDFLDNIGAPIPPFVIGSPMYSNPMEMDNMLQTLITEGKSND